MTQRDDMEAAVVAAYAEYAEYESKRPDTTPRVHVTGFYVPADRWSVRRYDAGGYMRGSTGPTKRVHVKHDVVGLVFEREDAWTKALIIGLIAREQRALRAFPRYVGFKIIAKDNVADWYTHYDPEGNTLFSRQEDLTLEHLLSGVASGKNLARAPHIDIQHPTAPSGHRLIATDNIEALFFNVVTADTFGDTVFIYDSNTHEFHKVNYHDEWLSCSVLVEKDTVGELEASLRECYDCQTRRWPKPKFCFQHLLESRGVIPEGRDLTHRQRNYVRTPDVFSPDTSSVTWNTVRWIPPCISSVRTARRLSQCLLHHYSHPTQSSRYAPPSASESTYRSLSKTMLAADYILQCRDMHTSLQAAFRMRNEQRERRCGVCSTAGGITLGVSCVLADATLSDEGREYAPCDAWSLTSKTKCLRRVTDLASYVKHCTETHKNTCDLLMSHIHGYMLFTLHSLTFSSFCAETHEWRETSINLRFGPYGEHDPAFEVRFTTRRPGVVTPEAPVYAADNWADVVAWLEVYAPKASQNHRKALETSGVATVFPRLMYWRILMKSLVEPLISVKALYTRQRSSSAGRVYAGDVVVHKYNPPTGYNANEVFKRVWACKDRTLIEQAVSAGKYRLITHATADTRGAYYTAH